MRRFKLKKDFSRWWDIVEVGKVYNGSHVVLDTEKTILELATNGYHKDDWQEVFEDDPYLETASTQYAHEYFDVEYTNLQRDIIKAFKAGADWSNNNQ